MTLRLHWLVIVLPYSAMSAQAPASVIISSGTASVSLPPDRATLSVAVEAHAATAAAASHLNDDKQTAVLDTLRVLGYSAQQARVVSYSVSPNIDYEHNSTLIDYEARTEIAIAITSLASLGATIDATLAAGGTEIRNIAFTSDSADAGRRRAILEATAAARMEASTLAEAAGGRLGPLLEVSTLPPLMGAGGISEIQAGLVARGFSSVGLKDVTFEVTVYTRWQMRRR